jgi:hypothetical protein
MRDEEDCQPFFALKLAKKREVRGLHRNIKRGGGLVSDHVTTSRENI